ELRVDPVVLDGAAEHVEHTAGVEAGGQRGGLGFGRTGALHVALVALVAAALYGGGAFGVPLGGGALPPERRGHLDPVRGGNQGGLGADGGLEGGWHGPLG